MSAQAMRTLSTAPTWSVVVGLVVLVAAVPLALPFVVTWLWPGVAPTLLTLGTLFVGMILGSAAVPAFLWWRWEVCR